MPYSLHIADVGAAAATRAVLRRARYEVAGLRYLETAWSLPIGANFPAPPRIAPGRLFVFGRWTSVDALDRFLATHRLGERLRQGWHVRLEPLRVHGYWPPLPDLPQEPLPAARDEPLLVVTIGRTMLSQLPRFLRTSNPAEKVAADSPDTTFTCAIVKLPNLIGTVSVWRTLDAMREYAVGRGQPAHLNAIREQRRKEFHHTSAFIRFRPLSEHGHIDGRRPVAEAIGPTAASDPSGRGAARASAGGAGLGGASGG